MININYTAVIIATIVNMILGFVWYGPLFGKQWSKLNGFTKEDMEKAMKDGMTKTYTITALGALIMSYILAHFITVGNAATAIDGAIIGFWIWLGFIATTGINDILFGRKTFNIYLIQAGYYLVVLAINGAILALWK